MKTKAFAGARAALGQGFANAENFLVAEHSLLSPLAKVNGLPFQLPPDSRPARTANNFFRKNAYQLECSSCSSRFLQTHFSSQFNAFGQGCCPLCLWLSIEPNCLASIATMSDGDLEELLFSYFEEESENSRLSSDDPFLHGAEKVLLQRLREGILITDALEEAFRHPKKSWFMRIGVDPRTSHCNANPVVLKKYAAVDPSAGQITLLCDQLRKEGHPHLHYQPLDSIKPLGLGIHVDILSEDEAWVFNRTKSELQIIEAAFEGSELRLHSA